MKEEQVKVCREAVNTFGIVPQVDMMQEEMNELGVEIGHWKRGRTTDDKVITEIADVLIMAQQMAYIFGEEEVEAEIERKIQRLANRIEEKNGSRPEMQKKGDYYYGG